METNLPECQTEGTAQDITGEDTDPSPQVDGQVEPQENTPIWAFAGGKGGVGKSLVALNMATQLALTGRRVVLVDGDLGAPNLHTLLGVRTAKNDLGSFADRKVESLEEILHPTCVPGLKLIAGSRDTLGAANPKYQQKTRFLRHLRRVDADCVILDLGAGTSFPVLDLFNGSSRKTAVLAPEPTSLQNAYSFLKMALYRMLMTQMGMAAEKDSAIRTIVRRALDFSSVDRVQSIKHLAERLRGVSAEGHSRMMELIRGFHVLLVVNMATPLEGRVVSHNLSQACQDFLHFEPVYAGNIGLDQEIGVSVRRMRPFLLDHRTGARWDEIRTVREALEGQRQGGREDTVRTSFEAAINESIEVDGIRFHVQTEDRGRVKAEVITQVFRSGQVVHSERNPYSFFRDRLTKDVPVQYMVKIQQKHVTALVRSGRVPQAANSDTHPSEGSEQK
jgi:flagellar biosynthesis protein FlhG